MEQKGYFHLPGLFECSNIYVSFLNMYNNEREKFNDWVEIECLYGNPSNAIWGGGRQAEATFNEIEVLNMTLNNNVKAALTFSNCKLEEKHLYDTYCNYIMRLFNQPGNYVIINSPVLRDYIKQYYPGYKMISSTTKCLTDFNRSQLELMNKDYALICLDYNFNNNFEILKQIEKKDKCELLINPVCEANCPRRAEHYDFISRSYLKDLPLDLINADFQCQYQGYPFYKAKQSSVFISNEDIVDKYMPMGFSHFKIEGRTTSNDDLIEILLYYLVKPEYQLEIRERLYGF